MAKSIASLPELATAMGTLAKFLRTAAEEGLSLGALQASIDDAEMRRKLIAAWSSGTFLSHVPYEETPAKRALEIVRHSYSHEDVTKHTNWEYPAYLRRMQEVVRLPEVLLEQHAEDSILMPMHPDANILAVRSLVEKKRKRSFYPQTWFDTEEFAKVAWADGWLLMLKGEVPDTRNLPRTEQIKHLPFGQSVTFTFERTFGVMLHYLETGERLTPDVWLRCQDVDSYGGRVYAGLFDADGFRVSSDAGGYCNPDIALGGLWKC